MYRYNDMLVLPQDLQDFAWSAPMRDLAATVGLSDVGLKKILKSHGIVAPPQGYWNKVLAGKPVPRCPTAAARGPGERGRVGLDHRFAGILPAADPLPSSGPFASAAVPEDIGELQARELRAIGKVTVPRTLERGHHELSRLLGQEARRWEKFAASNWSWDKPRFDSPVDQRRLRILNALFSALARRGHSVTLYECDGAIDAAAIVGDTRVRLEVDLAGQCRERPGTNRVPTSADLPAKTPLALIVDRGGDGRPGTTWQDDAAGTLESKLAEVAAGVVVAGEAAFRRGLKWAEEQAEKSRAWKQRQRRERAEARDRERLKQLRTSGDLLRQAEDLRALLARVRGAVKDGALAVDPADLGAWEAWASAEADRLDPVLSGQVMAHLLPPSVE